VNFNEFLEKFILIESYGIDHITNDLRMVVDNKTETDVFGPINHLSKKLLMKSDLTYNQIKTEFLDCVKNNKILNKNELEKIFLRNIGSHDEFHLRSHKEEFFFKEVQNPEIQFDLNFNDSDVTEINNFLTNSSPNVLIIKAPPDERLIKLIKAFQILNYLNLNIIEKFICLRSKHSNETHEIGSKTFVESRERLCLFECQDTNLRFARQLVLHCNSNNCKKLILIINNDDFIKHSASITSLTAIRESEFKNLLVSNLSCESQQRVLNKSCTFQGSNTKLSSLFSQDHIKCLKVTEFFHVNGIILFSSNNRLTKIDNYINRILICKNQVNDKILEDLVSEKLPDILVFTEDDFELARKIHSDKNIHLLEIEFCDKKHNNKNFFSIKNILHE
jgi:hypothetical protein